MRARRLTSAAEVSETALRFMRDEKHIPPSFELIRLRLELKDPTLFGKDSRLPGLWRAAGPGLIRELGLSKAKQLRCWTTYGDPRA